MSDSAPASPDQSAASSAGLSRYSYLGPAGTFTEAALRQVPDAAGQLWASVSNAGIALDDVVTGKSVGAVIAIENSVDGGVSANQDALATIPGLRITGEYLVSVNFSLVTAPGVRLEDVDVVSAHPVAYAQSSQWLAKHLPNHAHHQALSNVAAPEWVLGLADPSRSAAIAPLGIERHYPVQVLAEQIGDNPKAVTRFVLISRTTDIPAYTGSDKTSIIVELPSDRPGTLLELLELFSTRGINMSLIQSRPIGDELGRYRFVIDLEGHIHEERVADAMLGLRRFSPRVIFLGSYPKADPSPVAAPERFTDETFIEARDWLRGILSGEPDAD